MKQGHIAILFVIIYVSCFLGMVWEQEKYDATVYEKQKIEQALLRAIENTGREYETVLYETEEKKQQFFEDCFFESLYVFLEAFAQREKQTMVMIHTPLLVLIEEDGAFFNYVADEQDKNNAGVLRKWSEKIKFSYPMDCTEAEKKMIVAEKLENVASSMISKHNYIAKQFGIQYQFSVPDFLGNTEKSLEFPMLLVVFQGWPLTASGDITYENCMDAAVFLQKVEPKVPIPDGIPYRKIDGTFSYR